MRTGKRIAFGVAALWISSVSGAWAQSGATFALADFGVDAGWRTNLHLRFVVDITRDGCADIVGFGNEAVWTAVSRCNGTFGPTQLGVGNFTIAQQWNVGVNDPTISRGSDSTPRFVADITDDACADIVGINDIGVWTALARCDGTFGSPQYVLNAFRPSFRNGTPAKFAVLDVNNDHRADLVFIASNNIQVAISKGDGTFEPPILASTDFPFGERNQTAYYLPSCLLADVTNDQRPEFMSYLMGGVLTKLIVSQFQPDNSLGRTVQGGANFFDGNTFILGFILGGLVNVVGDAKADMIGFFPGYPGTYVAPSRGDGSFSDFFTVSSDFGEDRGWHADKHPRMAANVAGDSLADLVGFGDAGVYVAVNMRNGTNQYLPANFVVADLGYDQAWRIDQHPRLVADITGDGYGDLVGFGNAGVWTAVSNGDGTFGVQLIAVPDLTDKTVAGARTALQSVGLVLGSTSSVVDDLCEHLNRVFSQQPGAGALVARGTTVNIRLGQRPSHPCP